MTAASCPSRHGHGTDASTRNGWPATTPEAVGLGTSSSGFKLLIPSTRLVISGQDGGKLTGVGVMFVLCGILAGLAVYRFGEARATWQRFRANRTTLRGQRNTAWRRSGSALFYIGGAVFLLVIILKFR